MPLTTLQEALNRAPKGGMPPRLAIAAAQDAHTLEAAMLAAEQRIIEPILIGDREKIQGILKDLGREPGDGQIIDVRDEAETAAAAVRLVRENQADFLMKGLLHTSLMLKAVLNRETGLPHSGTVSHYVLAEIPAYHKLLLVTDGGIVISPTLEQKLDILKNAVSLLHCLGYDRPKVAVLTAVETVNPKMPETVDAQMLKEMNQRGELTGCLVEGPISMDLALSRESAQIKGFHSEVSGDPDILLVPSVAAGNIFFKALIHLAGAKSISGVLGVSVPLIVTSRGDTMEDKYHSILLAAAGIKR